MSKRHAYRPTALDHLEDRVVLSAALASTTVQYQVQTFNYGVVATAVNDAFNSFRTDINSEVNQFLNPGTSSSPVTLSDLQAFTTQRVGTLEQQLQSALIQVPGALNGLEPFILNQVKSQFGGDLLSQINGIPGASGSGGTPSTLFSTIVDNITNTTQLAANDLLSVYAWGFAQGENVYGSGSIPAQLNYASLASQLNQAFDAFRANFNTELNGFLNPGTGGSITAAQLQANTTQQASVLGQQLQTGLSSYVQAANGLTPFILNLVNSTVGGGLVVTLNNLPTNSGPGGTVDSLYGLAANDVLNSFQLAANDSLSVYNWGLNQGYAFAGNFVVGGNGNVIDQSNLSNALSSTQLAIDTQNVAGVKAAYQAFASAYSAAVQNTLDANAQAGANGTVNLSANQAAFNAQVSTALNALNTTVAGIYGTTAGAGTSFLPAIQQSLTGSYGLQSQLAGLFLPTDLNGTSNSTFMTASNNLIDQSYLNTVASANLFNLNHNFNFGYYASANGFFNGPYGAAFANYPTAAGTGFTA